MASWDPFDGVDLLRRQIDQAFEQYGPRAPSMWRTAFLPGRAAREYPLVNIYEDPDTVFVEALAPGCEPDSVKITVVGSMLTISGEKPRAPGEVKSETLHREERAAGKFSRNIELSVDMDDAKAKGEYKNGLLLISLPKSEKAKPRQIKVQAV